MNAPPAPDLAAVLGAWAFDAPTIAVLATGAVAYRWACRAAATRHSRSPVPAWRQAAFLAGVGVLAVALLSPVETYSGALLSVHMAQHLLLTMVAAPLLLLGQPGVAATRAMAPARRRRWVAVGHSRWARALLSPVVAWATFAAAGWAIHFSALFDAALRSAPLHVVEHGLFLGTALLFWGPVVGLRPGRPALHHPARLLYLALAMPQNTFLALAILGAGDVLYPHYAGLARDWGPSPLADQRQAAGVMWVAGDLLLLVAVVVVAGAWARREAALADREDGPAALDGASVAGVSPPPAGLPPSPRRGS